MPDRTTPGRLLARSSVSPVEAAATTDGGGRQIRWVILLPDRYDPAGRAPLVVAIHNFDGDAKGFAALIHAERLRDRGMIVALPQAGGRAPDWQGLGITLLAPATGEDGARVDDVLGVSEGIAILREAYGAGEVNLVGFSQGATLALAVTRRLDAERVGAVRRLFMAAGSLAGTPDDTLALAGTALTAYEPGHNLPQTVADWRAGDPSERRFLPTLLKIKGCTLTDHDAGERLDRTDYRCADGTQVTHIFEALGEHAWPGQDEKYDSWLTGRGSISALDYTDLIARRIAGP